MKLLRWLRKVLTNRMDEDWAELQAMSDVELCREFDRLLEAKGKFDRFDRARSVMALRFYSQVEALGKGGA